MVSCNLTNTSFPYPGASPPIPLYFLHYFFIRTNSEATGFGLLLITNQGNPGNKLISSLFKFRDCIVQQAVPVLERHPLQIKFWIVSIEIISWFFNTILTIKILKNLEDLLRIKSISITLTRLKRIS